MCVCVYINTDKHLHTHMHHTALQHPHKTQEVFSATTIPMLYAIQMDTYCNTLQHIVPRCNILQHMCGMMYEIQMGTLCNILQHMCGIMYEIQMGTLCHTLQQIATHCNTLQHTATHVNCSTWHGVCDSNGLPLCHTWAHYPCV